METTITEERKTMVCPLCFSILLDNPIRRALQPPGKVLRGRIRAGQRVMDLGCGPGFFTLEMARMVGPGGKVLAVDLQPGMLGKIRRKADRSGLGDRIDCLCSRKQGLGFQLDKPVDFVLAYYMIHETGNVVNFLRDIYEILAPGGTLLIVEPRLHVNRNLFAEMVDLAEETGFSPEEFPGKLGGRSVVFTR